MNDKIKWLTGSSFTTLVVLFALYGEKLAGSGKALVIFIGALASNLPGGLKSCLLSALVAGLFYSFVRRWLTCQHGARREFLSQLFALLVGIGITVAQQLSVASTIPPTPPIILQAVVIGLIAGFGAPLCVQGLASVFAKPAPQVKPDGS